MDNSLINNFREEVNDQDLILQMYRNRDGKSLWNIICSAMDWIDVVVDEIDTHKLSRGNNNKSSICFMTFITCVDVLWEAIQQLNRVFFNTDKVPFTDDDSIFKHKLFPATDNEYFKTIRACFAAHPINLNDKFSGTGEKERRYASWSGGGFGNGDFSVILYREYSVTLKALCCNGYMAKMRVSSARFFTRNVSKPLHLATCLFHLATGIDHALPVCSWSSKVIRAVLGHFHAFCIPLPCGRGYGVGPI